ncbi:MAG: thiamine pyrophosphate-dependent dehydrogenase E1 component subunit alpha [Dehalococcoidales bacterium]|nr:thiamine pyrophosphate-dependent dehydrogenase E1 component subunit alpha [Dehalococcoidales bacterium]
MSLNDEELFKLYQDMTVFRAIEDTMAEQAGSWHGAAGEEASHAGAFFGLDKDDIILPHFRGVYGVYYIKGVPLTEVFAMMYNRADGYSKGKAMGMAGNMEKGILPWCTGTLGPPFVTATGAALAIKLRKQSRVVVISFGDGTSSRGEFHESLNFASIYKLPIVFVCVNNQWGEYSATAEVIAAQDIADRALGYNMPGIKVDGNDVLAVHDVMQEAIAMARRGDGPSLIECKTYRLGGHTARDKTLYRRSEDAEPWKKRDPIKILSGYLVEKGVLTEQSAADYTEKARAEVLKALQTAEAGPRPPREKEFAMSEIFAP